MPRKLAVILLMVAALAALAGCADEPTPAPDPIGTMVSVVRSAGGTLTAEAPTPTPTATSTPLPTSTPTLTPTPTPSMTPTPTPTVLPHEQLDKASRDQTNGIYVQSILAYWDLLGDELSPEQEREAHYRIAEAYQLDGEYVAAALAWDEFVALYPEELRLPQALFMAGRAYQAANLCGPAIDRYQAYLAEDTVLADLAREWIGECHAIDGEMEKAVHAYEQALAEADDPAREISLREKIASAYLGLDEYGEAIVQYEAILELTEEDDLRAKMEYLAGQALAADGQIEGAFERYQIAVDNYPEAEHAYFALVELVYGGAEVDEFQRGLIDYYAGAKYPDALGASIRAFDRFLEADPGDRADEAMYYRALAQRAEGMTAESLASLELLISEYPASEILDQAWQEKADILAEMGDVDGAVAAYAKLSELFPESELAPEALWSAARLRQVEGDFAGAASLYLGVQAAFPNYEDVDAALWYAGLNHYRAGNVEEATSAWRMLLDGHPDSVYAPKTMYWLGKVGAEPAEPETAGYWEQLSEDLPDHYYTLRIQQLESGESLTTTRLITGAVESPSWDGDQFEAEVLPWLVEWAEIPTSTESLSLPVTVTGGVDLPRAERLLEVGLRREALAIYAGIVASEDKDPLALAALAGYLRERGLYGLAATSATSLIGMSPEGSIYQAPESLQQVAYPLVYADLISTEALERDLDPLLLAALLRQESLFEPAAESWVGARGLGQVMPSTGQGIAEALGVQDFVVDDLYRPSTSIRFAAYYLASQLAYFDDHILVALSAYNGGPGNTLAWLEAGGDDLDLFIEAIGAVESRLYLQNIYGQYLIYEELYREVE